MMAVVTPKVVEMSLYWLDLSRMGSWQTVAVMFRATAKNQHHGRVEQIRWPGLTEGLLDCT